MPKIPSQAASKLSHQLVNQELTCQIDLPRLWDWNHLCKELGTVGESFSISSDKSPRASQHLILSAEVEVSHEVQHSVMVAAVFPPEGLWHDFPALVLVSVLFFPISWACLSSLLWSSVKSQYPLINYSVETSQSLILLLAKKALGKFPCRNSPLYIRETYFKWQENWHA